MAEAVTNELMYEILKKIRDDVAYIRQRADDHDEQFKGVRHMQSDDIRQKPQFPALRVDMDKIKRRRIPARAAKS
jgi:hypothetical protein